MGRVWDEPGRIGRGKKGAPSLNDWTRRDVVRLAPQSCKAMSSRPGVWASSVNPSGDKKGIVDTGFWERFWVVEGWNTRNGDGMGSFPVFQLSFSRGWTVGGVWDRHSLLLHVLFLLLT